MSFFRRQDPIATELEALGFARDAAQRLARQGTVLRLRDGATLCTEGELGRQAFVLLDGDARVLVGSGVVTIGAGEVVGEIATLDPRRTRNATVLASGQVDVLVFDARAFRDLADDPALRPLLAPERTAA